VGQSALPASKDRFGRERQHHIRHSADVRTEKPRRHHTDDGERHALNAQLRSDDVVDAAKALLPESMTDDGDESVCQGLVVIGGCDHPAAYRRHAEHVEEPAADVRAVDSVAPAARC
jgi:hypothetical protein